MPANTPRQRLAEAVEACDRLDRKPQPFVSVGGILYEPVKSGNGYVADNLLAAARAVLAAPDEPSLTFTGSSSLWHGDNCTHIRIDRVLTDAEVAAVGRALDPDAPDDAAELRAVKALQVWIRGMEPPRAVNWNGGEWMATQYRHGPYEYMRVYAPTATELCAKLGVPHD